MDSNQKKFGVYIFLSTFSRSLIEVFIPVILYKYGYSLKEVIFNSLLANVISLLITYPIVYLSNKFNNKILSAIGTASFIILQILLNFMNHSWWYLALLAFFYALYRRGYWIARRYYNLEVVKKDKISSTYSILCIINQIAVIFSAYIGSLMLDYISVKSVTIIAMILFVLSLIPVCLLKFEHEKKSYELNLRKTIKQIPLGDIYIFGSYELINVIKLLISLYLVIYVKNTYHTVGFVNLITNLSIVLFIFLFGRKLDKSTKNYLRISIILTVLIYVLKVNSMGIVLYIVSFIEGIALRMYELSLNKEFFILSKEFEYYNYNLVYEISQNLFRSLILFVLMLTNLDVKNMIYVTLIFVLVGSLIKFKPKKEIGSAK